MPTDTEATCHGCGFRAPMGGPAWDAVDHPTLGSLTRCPDCGSTDVHSQPSAGDYMSLPERRSQTTPLPTGILDVRL